MPDDNYQKKPIQSLDDNRAYIRVTSDYEAAKANKSDDLERAKRYINIYKTLDPPDEAIDESTGLIEDDESMYSNTYMAVGAAVVDSAVAKLYNIIFATGQYMEMESDNLEDMFHEEILTAHTFKRLKEMKFKSLVYETLQEASCFDYAVTGSRWLLEGGYVPKKVNALEDVQLGNIITKRRQVTSESIWIPDKIDRSDVFKLNYMRCYHDWTAEKGLKDSRFFCDDRDVMMEELMQDSERSGPWGKYKNIDKVLSAVLQNVKQEYDKIADSDVRLEFVNNRRVKVIRYWTKNHIIEVAEGYVIRRLNVPDWMIHIWKIFTLPNDFRGMGFLQRLERNQYDINASLNSRRNYQNLVSNPFAVIDEDLLGEHQGEPRIYPGLVLANRGNKPAGDRIWVYSPAQNANLDTAQDVEAQIRTVERQTGVSEADQSQVSPGRTTATEIQVVQSGAGTRKEIIAERLETDCLEPIYMDIFLLEQRFLTQKESFWYNGEHGKEFFVIDPSKYQWNSMPRFNARGTVTAIKSAVETQQFVGVVDQVMKISQFAKVNVDWDNIVLEMFRKLAPKEHWKFVKDPNVPQDNIPPEIENRLIAQGMRINTSPANNHPQHIPVHKAEQNSPDYQTWSQPRKLNMVNHIQQHEAQAQQATGQAQLQQLGAQTGQETNANRGQRTA